MSDLAKAAIVSVELADFANTDAAGKLNVVGGGIGLLGFDSVQGLSSRFALAFRVHVPYAFLPADFSLEVALYSNDEPVSLPGPAGPQALRVALPVALERSTVSPVQSVREHIGASHTSVLDFAAGLPLAVNGTYEWRVRIDGDDEHVTKYPFAVVGPPPEPVFG